MPARGSVSGRSSGGGAISTDIGAVWRWTVILVILPDLVEVIFVQLSDEGGKVAVFEVFR